MSFLLSERDASSSASSFAAVSLAAKSATPFSTSTIRTVITMVRPIFVVSPTRIFFAERSFPTCTAQALSVQPVIWKPCSFNISFIWPRSTTVNTPTSTRSARIISVTPPATTLDTPFGWRSRTATCIFSAAKRGQDKASIRKSALIRPVFRMAFLLSLDCLRGGLFRTREKRGRNPLAAVTVYTLSKFCLAISRGR
ncbi:MAG TPA: hypothetical protein PK875_14730, partial [Spirochaetota bacterium]|nr:hypothetical protein [Spirochaetota bacterium]